VVDLAFVSRKQCNHQTIGSQGKQNACSHYCGRYWEHCANVRYGIEVFLLRCFSALEMNCTNASSNSSMSGITWEIFAGFANFPVDEWNAVVPADRSFLSIGYLRALSESDENVMSARAAIFKRYGKVIGVGVFQITHFTTSEDAYTNWFLRLVNAVASIIRGRHVHNVLICGNALATGEHGCYFLPNVSSEDATASLVSAMDEIAAIESRRGKRICAMVVKDFYPRSATFAAHLENYRFKTFRIDHNMVLPLLPEWRSFDDYLNSMNTKFRTKAKAALAKSAPLEAVEMDEKSITAQMNDLSVLYGNVHNRADFRLGSCDLSVMPAMKLALGPSFRVLGFFLKGELVGFMTAFACGDALEAHVIGFDYELNRQYSIYSAMLYKYVEWAIAGKSSYVIFGRTAAEIKSSIGAYPVDLICAFRHNRFISNALLSRVFHYVKPSPFDQRFPYKGDNAERTSQRLTPLLVQSSHHKSRSN
jgi:hypothetical protein